MPGTIVILNGPNLNMLGVREPEIYGTQTLEDVEKLCVECANSLSMKISFKQSNHEGQIIDWIQDLSSTDAVGLVINPAGLGHSSVALMDALITLKLPVVEVHLSNIHKREAFRHHTYSSRAANGVITGFGSYGYLLAIYALSDILRTQQR